jgi:hypothetical protein
VTRNADREGAPLADHALDANVAAEKIEHAADDAQAETRSATLGALVSLDLPERLEDLLEVLRGDSSPRIAYDDRDPIR